MVNLIYKVAAPILRLLYKNRITSKRIKNSPNRLYYFVDQHLGFWGKPTIQYEPECMRIIGKCVTVGDVVFDIGANIGQYTLFLSGLLGSGGKLISIEPDSDNYAFLHFNLSMNKCSNVKALQCAVGGVHQHQKFYKDSVTGGRMSSLIESNVGNSFNGKTEEVEVITMSDLIDMYGIPDFIKIDVEGAEFEVLDKLDNRLMKTIIFVETRKETKNQVFDLFAERNRQVYLIDNGLHLMAHANAIPDYANLIIK